MDKTTHRNIEPMRALRSADFSRCFYCGCEQYAEDIIPAHGANVGQGIQFIGVPSCYECLQLLQKCTRNTLEQRQMAVKKALEKKYHKALRVHQMWTHEELDEMGHEFRVSIEAGLRLGQEAFERIQYPGFDYELDGDSVFVARPKPVNIEVDEQSFDNFKEALAFASQRYQIPQHHLNELYIKHNHSFAAAVAAHHQSLERQAFERDLKHQCEQFAEQYSQNTVFVMRSVERFMNQDDTISIQDGLNLYFKRFILE